MFNTKFNKWAKQADLDLFPTDLEDAAAKANEWIYPNINNGVYRWATDPKRGPRGCEVWLREEPRGL